MAARVLHYSDIENAYDDPERIARLGAAIGRHRDHESLVVGTGDTTAPGLLSMETDGRHALAFFEAVDPDFATFGNHDFDRGIEALREVLERSPQTWLTANLIESGTDRPLGADQGARRTAVADLDGRRVGLFGLTDPETVRNHGRAEGIDVRAPVPAAREAIEHLQKRDVDGILALSHLGRDGDAELAEAVDVDAILGGHTHDTCTERLADTVLVRPGARADYLSVLEFDGSTPRADLASVPEFDPDPSLEGAYRDLRVDLGLDETVARIERPLPRGEPQCYPESRVGNLVVDAYRWVADADVAVCNAKMLRAGPPITGAVTVGDLRALTPFENDICSTELTGRELETLFSNLPGPAVGIDLPEVFAHVSGATLTWRRTEESIDLVDAEVGGRPLSPEETYVVAAPSFAFLNDLFAPLSGERRQATHADQHEALLQYVRENGVPGETEGRMTATVDTDPESLHSLR